MRNFITAVLLCSTSFAFALTPTDFTVQRVTSPYFVVDGNSPTSGPQSAYVGFKVTNTSASTTYSNLKFTITSIGTSVAGQNYSLTSPASGIVLAGTLAPGESKVCYYFVSYPANTSAQATFNYTLSDATANSKTGSFSIANRSAISANAGGLATQTISNQDLIGGIVYDDITYTLGNIKAGDENDFQVSVSTQFDPTKLALLKTQVISSTVPGITTGTTDQLYYTTTGNQSSGTVTIRWTFKISSFNFTALVLPYAGATSGSTNYKYAISTDLGGGTPITISSSANPLIITKTSDKSLYQLNGTALFTVTIQNPGTYPVSIDKITDQVPVGFVYQSLSAGSGVTTSNSTSYPSASATGTIKFEGGVASGSTQSYIVPANGSLVLKYTAVAPSSVASNLTTTAAGFVGTTQFGSAQNTVGVSTTLPVTIQSFKVARANGNTIVSWTTSSEINSEIFEVQRSNDGVNFSSVGTVNAKHNSYVTTNYTFTDNVQFDNTQYYRLLMVDKDGVFTYSSVVSLKRGDKEPFFEVVHYSPAHIQVKIKVNQSQSAELRLIDSKGIIVQRQTVSPAIGINSIEVNTVNLAKGVYYLQCAFKDKALTQPIIIH